MSQPDSASVYSFVTVEDFFSGYRSWSRVTAVKSWSFDQNNKTLILDLSNSDGTVSVARLQFFQANILRFRFCPHGHPADPEQLELNSRAIVMDRASELQAVLDEGQPFTVDATEDPATAEVRFVTRRDRHGTILTVSIVREPFRMTITDSYGATTYRLLESDDNCLFFRPNGPQDFSVVHAIRKPATARYIGFGEQGGKSLVKNTEQVNYFNFDNMRYRQVYNQGPLDPREPLYHSDPFFVEFNGNPEADSLYGVFVDNPAQVFVDVGFDNSQRYLMGTRFGDLDYYFIAGNTATDVLQDLTKLRGRSRLKPRYALGYHQGCYGYENWGDIYQAVNSYRAAAIPIDGIHVDVDIQRDYQTFTVDENPGKFPNAGATFADLRAKGIKCSTNITPIISNRDNAYQTYAEGRDKNYFVADRRQDADDPAGRRYQVYNSGSEGYYDFTDPEGDFNSGRPYVGEVYYGGDRGTTGHYPDLGRRQVRDWWGAQYQQLFDLGLEMVWQDMTTPAIRDTRGDMRGFPFRLKVASDWLSSGDEQLDLAIRVWNLYSYNLHKATYHGLNHLRGRENKRNFIVGRGSFSGMHRFAALWTGDNASSWDFLRINVSQVLSLGMCGIAICGQDIGGFEKEFDWQQWTDPELLMRWTIAGAFLPWFRNHYVRKGRKLFQEPYAYQHVNPHSVPADAWRLYPMVLPVCRYYIGLRYRLLQLLYDAMVENCLNGLPICRSLILTDPKDYSLYNDKEIFLDNQFMVRNDLLIAPVLEPQSQQNANGCRDVYLPAGHSWYSFRDNRLPLGSAIEGGTTVGGFDAGLDDRLNTDWAHIGFLVPIYVRAGAIVPTIELEQYVGERHRNGLGNPVTLNVYPGGDGDYTMYLDDGVSRSSARRRADTDDEHHRLGGDRYANNEYREVRITNRRGAGGARRITIARVHDGYTPPETYFFVAVLHDPSESVPAAIGLNGTAVEALVGGTPESRAERLWDAGSPAWYHNDNIHISFVKVFDQPGDIVLDVTAG
jgi:alpha-glucosidase